MWMYAPWCLWSESEFRLPPSKVGHECAGKVRLVSRSSWTQAVAQATALLWCAPVPLQLGLGLAMINNHICCSIWRCNMRCNLLSFSCKAVLS
jgi:hypothetical protein